MREVMTAAYAGSAKASNSGSGRSCTATPNPCTLFEVSPAITEVFKEKFPLKTWAHIGSSLGLQERAAKYRASNSRTYTSDELAALLRGEEGLDFLVAVMGDARPIWWRWALKVLAIAAVRRRQAEDQQLIMRLEAGQGEPSARRRIKGAMDANKRVSAAIARAEAALGFQDPNLDRVDGPRSGGANGLPDRAVAGKKGKRRSR